MIRLCSIEGCAEPHVSRGYCASHAERVRKYGNPMVDKPLRKTGATKQFLEAATASSTDECILWPFARNDQGYGQLSIANRIEYAHREACRRVHGEPPTPNHEAAHSCGRGHEGCINPKHLSWKTHAENQEDRIEHGTSNRGVAHGMAKLTIGKVREIRRIAGSASHSMIAKRYGVSPEAIRAIIIRKTWAWHDP